MKRSIFFCLISLFGLLFNQCQAPTPTTDRLLDWPKAANTARPWTRWWWMGNAVDTANLNWQLTELAKAGIGGVEISPIYGVKGFEEQFIDHLSPAWVAMLDYTVAKAEQLGMQADMIQGTGWPFGGPQIDPDHAASRLLVQTYQLTTGKQLMSPIQIEDERQRPIATLEAVLAYDKNGVLKDLTEEVDENGMLNWRPEQGTWEIYALFCGKTRMQVKRAAPGGAGWVMDHFSKQALQNYLKPYDQALANLQHRPRALFNDSYEVGAADWTAGFLDAFAERRGYDLRPYLPLLLSDVKNDTVARLRSDYRETLSDLLLQDFTEPWAAWAHDRGYQIKNQAHGSPGNLLDLYAAADIPECESFSATPFDIPGLRRDTFKTQWEDPDPIMIKMAAAAAHVAGRPLTSAESMTWLGDHFQVSLSQCKPEMEQLFLCGVNHIFFHGTTYSPEDEPWPGWKFYAATHFAPHNTIWRDAPAFFDYITRVQSVLQNSRPDNELLVYWPIYDIWDDTEHGGLFQQLTIHRVSEWLIPSAFYQLVKELIEAGYSVDFISDRQLIEATAGPDGIQLTGGHYKALILPDCERLPASTFQHMLDLAAQGGRVLMADLPDEAPGWRDREKRSLALQQLKAELSSAGKESNTSISRGDGKIFLGNRIQETLSTIGIQPETVVQSGLKFLRQKWEHGYYYYFVNHTAKAIDDRIALATRARSAVLMDPQSGRTGLAQLEQNEIRLQLLPGEAMIVRTFTDRKIDGPLWHYEDRRVAPIPIDGPWAVTFLDGGPQLPSGFEKNSLSSWTEWSEAAANFSGTARYRTTIPKPAAAADEYLLDLGQVRESARVFLNGKEIGTTWSIPFRVRIDGADFRDGDNQLEIEVTNLGANRIRYMDREGIVWKKFYDTNVVHKTYQPFDASGWPDMPSGLLGPVSLKPL